MSNHLASESSPYLKMHAENPVDWYPWNDESLAKASAEDKPILLSIGYTACHWCHVMAHESFEDHETAHLMNMLFVNIKVDREERPDLDKVYQLSAQLLTRQPGGWPLTIFLLPHSRIPFFAGTYFPKQRRGEYPSFKEVLNYVASLYQQHKEQLQQKKISFENIILELESQGKLKATALSFTPAHKGLQTILESTDKIYGGFGNAPKFPMSTTLEFLLLNAVTGNKEAEETLLLTLNNMVQGGIYDQIGNGFFRYAVDEKWQIPHFEKMLYDNSLLITLLCNTLAFKPELMPYRAAVKGAADWLLEEMQGIEGGFYATLSADTEGKEGLYYIWTKEEIENLLSQKEYEVISWYYGLYLAPNFQKKWHLVITNPPESVAKKLNKDLSIVLELIASANTKLYQARQKRSHPQRDEKIIVSWNGLTIKALSLAARYLQDERYLIAAKKCVDFILNTLWTGKELFSVYKDGTAKYPANLDDYVFLIEGILYLLQEEWSTAYLDVITQLAITMCKLFEDKEAGGFFYTSAIHEKLIYRLKQYTDESLPSSDAVGTRVIVDLGFLLGNTDLLITADNSLKNVFPHLDRYPDAYASFLSTLVCYLNQTQIIIVKGNKASLASWRQMYQRYYHPNRLAFFEELSTATQQAHSETVAHYCIGQHCLAPIRTIQEFEHELRSHPFRITI